MTKRRVPRSKVTTIWPGLAVLGYRTPSAAYAAVKRRVIPAEALVRIGELTRIRTDWIDQKLKGGGG
jgi:hypothetical protein